MLTEPIPLIRSDADEDTQMARILNNLDPTQESIVSASSQILKMTKASLQPQQHAQKVVSMWYDTLFNRQNSPLPLLYLSNDLIQRSKIKQDNNYPDQFKERMMTCFTQIICNLSHVDQQLIIKVLNVWQQRKIYDQSYIDQLRKVLEIPNDDDCQAEEEGKFLKRIDFGDAKGNPLESNDFQVWVKIAEKKSQCDQYQQKIVQVETQIEKLIREKGVQVETKCKLQELELTIERSLTMCKKPLLQTMTSVHTKLENSMLEQLLLLDRIDQLELKLAKLQSKLEIP